MTDSPARELAHAIHGTVVGAAALTAASLHGSPGEVVVTVVVTLLVYWVAERYARVLSVAVDGPHRLDAAMEALRHSWPMVQTLLIALVVATVLLGGLGHFAARRAGAAPAAAVGWGALSAGLGVVISVLKLSLH